MNMSFVAEVIGLIDIVLSLSGAIYNLVQDVKSNKERCRLIWERVEALEDLVRSIKQKKPERIPTTVLEILKQLITSLEAANALLVKFTKANRMKSIGKAVSFKDDFHKMDKRLKDDLEMLVGALVVEQGSVLNNVYNTVKETGPRRRRRQTVLPMSTALSPTTAATAALTPATLSPTTAATPALGPAALSPTTATTPALGPAALSPTTSTTAALAPAILSPTMAPLTPAVFSPIPAITSPIFYSPMALPSATTTPYSFSNVVSRPGTGSNIVINSTINPGSFGSFGSFGYNPSTAGGAVVVSSTSTRLLL